MKILYLITKSEIGGAQVHVRDLMSSLSLEGHEIALMSKPGGWLEEEAKRIGVKFYQNKNFSNSLNPLNAIKAIRNIKNATKDFMPDLVSLHSSGAGFLGRLAIRKKVPTIFTAHSWAFTKGSPFFRKIIAIVAEKIVANYTNKIICVSEFDRQLALKHQIAPSSRLVTVHNGVEIKPLLPIKKIDNKIRIVSVGRLAYPKFYTLLLKAYKALPEGILKKTELVIIGAGPYEKALRKKIIELELHNAVTIITGAKKEDVFSELMRSDIFVLISKHEGLPLTILEAMSAGLPVIASDVGGIPEEIDPSCGILIKKNDLSEILKALTKLVEDDQARLKMGTSAREKAEKLFSLEKFLAETKKVYDEVLLSAK